MFGDPIVPAKTKIGWIGTGVMGAPMCGHLRRAGYFCTVFNRTRAKADSLVSAGAQISESLGLLAAFSDVIFTMVGFPHDVREVILGKDGVLAHARRGAVIVDMTTSEPALAREIYDLARPREIRTLDAPVSGGDKGAREATLSIMVGGDREVFDYVGPLFQIMGKTIVHQGPAGSGQHTKMVNQTLIATLIIGLCEALLYAYKAGLNLETVLQSVSGGAAGSWSLTNYAPRILKGNLDPGFFVEHFLKDLGVALTEADRMNLSLPGLALARQLYVALRAQGHGKKGIHALILALAHLSNVDWEQAFPPKK